HFAGAFENHTLVDRQRGRLQVPFDAPRLVQLDQLRSPNVAFYPAVDDHRSSGNLGRDSRPLANDQGVLGHDLSATFSIDSDLTFEGQFSFELATFSQQRIELAAPCHHVVVLPIQ